MRRKDPRVELGQFVAGGHFLARVVDHQVFDASARVGGDSS